MQGYRVFNNVRKVSIEIQILGYRVRSMSIASILLGMLCIAAGASARGVVLILAIPVAILFFLFAIVTTVAARWMDPQHTLREWTLWSLLIGTTRKRWATNATLPDVGGDLPHTEMIRARTRD